MYRGYVHLYGTEAPLKLAQHIGSLESTHAGLLKELPEGLRQSFLQRKETAAENKDALRWVMPQPILDEDMWRRGNCA